MVRDKAKMKGGRRVTLLRLVLVVPVFLLLCFAFTLPLSSFESSRPLGNGFPVRDPVIPLVGNAGESPVQALVGALRSATVAASAYRNVSFNDVDAETWRYYNPCKARAELGPRYARRPRANLVDPNPQWDLVLEEYAALHRTCMRTVGNITEYYLSGATTSSCKFLIMEIGGVGLGNKVAVMISAMLYAVLTQRVILVNGESLLPWTMCEPFLGSCWMLDQHFPLPGRHGWESTMLGRWAGWESPDWKSSRYFEKGVDARKAGRDAPSVSAVKVDHSDPEKTRFFCNTEQAFLTKATWLHFSGCLYFLPKLFAVPAFRPALEALFPDPSLTLTYLLRSLMLPRNDVWEQVKQHDQDLFADVDHRVGIQIRFLYGRKVYFKGASKRANDHVKQCVAENNILPKIELETKSSSVRPGQVTRVLVTSLHTALSEELLKMYENRRTATGETVKITQLTHRGQQGFSTDEDLKAMVEIMLLSLVDELLVTPLSTFGGLAQAYGAILPWFVEVKKDDVPCARAQTFDLCYQMAHSHYDCPHEPNIDRKLIQSVLPYMRRCLPIEESIGLQLVSSK
ncbi:hypothetical protein KC19_4G051000 [Ceratodon purpureus]|uniref:Fucosyltransferase n=1 Tax=Ceratodon purpureus TaxID=3225 RepID=A0A8T0I809_CERPU|nr:hypothetical protein KC19_4G051000 [Ceratodon purpureus]